ncbi:PAS domain-containing hybrid sensor histidine kinase/response regulator [Chitinilyticum aquatile]|uniref:PAS domain-containing hybrid sensor histidine kinase/response regulator n=1 Tax=Chitinilyticum aquatile TaxID=362520 RepID=UPI000422E93D|nr:PAS domain-containing hybrid sensor histidine kinase/response regulator [Chitinilyticum aquatile]
MNTTPPAAEPPPADLLLAACQESVLLVDAQTLCIAAANPAAEVMLHYPPGALAGLPVSQVESGLSELFYWEEVSAGEYRTLTGVRSEYQRRDGSTLPVERSVRPVSWQGRTWLVISSHDISSMLMQEQLNARNSALLSTTLEATVDGLLVTGLDGRIEHFNHRFAEFWMLSPDLLQGSAEGIRQAMLQQMVDRHAFELWWLKTLEHPHHDYSFTCVLRDGRVIELSSRPQILNDRPIGRVTGFHDMTRIKQHETALLEARDQAQAANQAKSDFLSHMSHELRTPLNAILGFAHLLREDTDEGSREMVGHILTAGQHLLALINEVLDLASIEAGRLRISLEPLDLAPVIEDCLMLVRPLAQARGITITLQGAPAGQYCVIADARRLRQMLINLLSNAVKYNREHGSVSIAVSYTDHGMWRISVTDTGLGMTDTELKQLFQPFSRVGKHQNSIEGTGIGLAFTRKLALLMHGNIGVESEAGTGSRFWIDLPAGSLPLADRCPPQAEHEDSSSPQMATLLYIEDDELNQRVLQSVFARLRPQFCLIMAGSLGDGLQLLEQAHPDLLLLDLHLPDGAGLGLLQCIRHSPSGRTLPVIALSGDSGIEQAAAALESGFAGYLTKPLDIDVVVKLVDDMLAAHRLGG